MTPFGYLDCSKINRTRSISMKYYLQSSHSQQTTQYGLITAGPITINTSESSSEHCNRWSERQRWEAHNICSSRKRSLQHHRYHTSQVISYIPCRRQHCIEAALRGQDALIITMSVYAPKDTSEILIRAAAAAGVPWLLPNTFGMYNREAVHLEVIGPGKVEERNLIEGLGASSWIGFSCGFWYEHALSQPDLYGFDIQNRVVTFFDDGTERLNTSTWAQVGRAVASVLSLPIQPASSGNNSTTTLSEYRNRMVYLSSFTVNQKDMFESLKRVTGTSDAEWTVSRIPAKQRFEEARASIAAGNPLAFGRMLGSRFFFPGDNEGLYEISFGLDNAKLGLPEEYLDEFTRAGVELAASDYWAKYGRD
jgi:hypothetical protein